MKPLFAFASLLLLSSASYATGCPWKVKDIGGEIDKAVDRIAVAWIVADEKNKEIAAIRRDVIVDCQGNDGLAKLDAFQATIEGFDAEAEVTLGATLTACVDEKRAEAKTRLDSARAAGNGTLERRLLQIAADIERYAPRALDHEVSVNQLVSKISRLNLERDRLFATCESSDF